MFKIKKIIRNIPFIGLLIFHIFNFFKTCISYYRFKKMLKKRPIKLVVGSSGFYDEGWIGSDAQYLNLLNKKNWSKYFEKSSITAILAEHVWEHLTLIEGINAAKQCYDYLKPGGYLRVAVPDGLNPNKNYINSVKVGGTGPGADDHKILYTYKTLSDVFYQAGFSIQLLEYYNEQGKLKLVEWDDYDGKIYRSVKNDIRNQNGTINYTSLIIDAIKK